MKITTRALIIQNNEILLVKHHGSDFWSLPGGKVEGNEDLKKCLIREMKEELSVDAEIGKLCFINEFKYEKEAEPIVEFFFEVKNPRDFELLITGSHTKKELAEVQWRKIGKKMNLKPDFLEEKINNLPFIGGEYQGI